MEKPDVQAIVAQAINEYMRQDTARVEPAYKTELQEERRRREQAERRLNEMADENKKVRAMAEEAQRAGAIRSELQRLGVVKVDLAFRAVQDRIVCGDDGRLTAGSQSVSEYLTEFVQENPEFLPARIAGGTGMTGTQKTSPVSTSVVDLDRISPSMSKEDLERARQEILRVASQSLR